MYPPAYSAHLLKVSASYYDAGTGDSDRAILVHYDRSLSNLVQVAIRDQHNKINLFPRFKIKKKKKNLGKGVVLKEEEYGFECVRNNNTLAVLLC
jgi:hypothetical protein